MNDNVRNPILEGLQSSGMKPTLVAQLRRHLGKIEECIEAGFTHRQIHGWLKQLAIDVPYPSYERTVMRLLHVRSVQATDGRVPAALPSRAGASGSAPRQHVQASQAELHRDPALGATVGSGAPAAIHSEKQAGFDQQAGDGHSIMVAPGYHDKPAFSWDPTRRVVPDRT